MKKSLHDYLMLVEREYEYKLKIAGEVTENQFDLMENVLLQYDLIDVKSINRLPIQNNPLDFKNLPPSEIYIVDFVTRMPLPITVITDKLSRCADINQTRLIVRGKNDPYEQEIETVKNREESDYVVKVSDPEYKSDGTKSTDDYGTDYNEEVIDAVIDETGTGNKKEFNKKFREAFNNFKKSPSVLQKIKNDVPEAK